MYTSTEELDAYFADTQNQKPYIFCEYLHAMGNSCGDTEDYSKLWNDMLALVVALYGSGAIIRLICQTQARWAYGGDFN